jgi:hypothetical protein
MSDERNLHTISQVAGGIIAGDAAARAIKEAAAIARQDQAFAEALKSIDQVRNFVGSPSNILGNSTTKHGEIAEHVEVGVRKAMDYLQQQVPSATFEGVGRTAPEDYLIDGTMVQSKFVNGVSQNLDHVLDHMHKYQNFGRDGSYYHIPRDHFETIQKVLRGEHVEGLSQRTIDAISSKAREIESLSGGHGFEDVVKPGVSKYAEVQQGRVHHTLDRHEQELENANEEIKQQIRDELQPSIGEALGAVGKGALVGAGTRVAVSVYAKYKQGKHLFNGDYTAEDWKELGVEAGKGAVQGGVAAGAIYALTQYAGLAAPFAGAFVSSTMALVSLTKRYHSGELSFEEWVELVQLTCVEGAIVGLASALGQAIIPIPALGALVGAVAGRWLVSLGKDFLGQDGAKLASRLESEHRARMAALDHEVGKFVAKMLVEYERLGSLTRAAFDLNRNAALRLEASIDLARAYGVEESKIIHGVDELDAFMLG